MTFKALGQKDNEYKGLETFAAPNAVSRVKMVSDEVTALCPVTGQPDWYVVEIEYIPEARCIESKTLKLFLQSLRNEGMFCEVLSELILKEVVEALKPLTAQVKVVQKPRGGISIEATSTYSRPK